MVKKIKSDSNGRQNNQLEIIYETILIPPRNIHSTTNGIYSYLNMLDNNENDTQIYIRVKDQRPDRKTFSIDTNFSLVPVSVNDVSKPIFVCVICAQVKIVKEQLTNCNEASLGIKIQDLNSDLIILKQENCDRISTGAYLVAIDISEKGLLLTSTIYPVMNVIMHFRVPKPDNWEKVNKMSLLCDWDNRETELKPHYELCKRHSSQLNKQGDCKDCITFLQATVIAQTIIPSNLLLKSFHSAGLQEPKFRIKKIDNDGSEEISKKEQSIWLSGGKTKRIYELCVLTDINKRPEIKTPWLECKRDRLIVDFANFLGNIHGLDASLRMTSNVKGLYAKMLVPNISDDGSYVSSEADNPQAWFDIWGKDLEDEAKMKDGKEIPKSAITYCQLRMLKFPGKGSARKEVIERLRNAYKARETRVFNQLSNLCVPHEEWSEQTQTDVFASGLVDTANEVYSIVDEKCLHKMLQNSAAIVRGRMEARFLGEKVHRGCLVAKAWFALMMAVWQQMQKLEDNTDLSTSFEQKVREDTMNVPAFYTWCIPRLQ